MSEHSILPPSSAARRVACPGSRALEAAYPRADSQSSREGTAAHWVAAQLLNQAAGVSTPSIIDWLYHACLKITGEVLTDEMVEGATLYANFIGGILSEYSNSYCFKKNLHIEERLDIPSIHPQCWGTPDAWIYTGRDIHIFDYKYGHGYVDVYENWQLIAYAAGVIDFFGENYVIPSDTKVFLHIVQPRCFVSQGSTRTWETSVEDLLPYFEKLSAAEVKSMQPEANCIPNTECTHCAASHVCKALQRSALSYCDYVENNVPFELTPAQQGAELRKLKHAADILEARINGLEEEVTAGLKSGKHVPYFRLEQSVGREQWKVSDAELQVLTEIYDKPLSKGPKWITPKQAIKAGIPPEVVREYSQQFSGAMKLVPANKNKINFGAK